MIPLAYKSILQMNFGLSHLELTLLKFIIMKVLSFQKKIKDI